MINRTGFEAKVSLIMAISQERLQNDAVTEIYIIKSQIQILRQSQNYKLFTSNIVQINKKMQYMDVLLSYTQTSDPQQLFELLDILGQGAYGNVSKALHKQTGQLYAIKILPATSLNEISVIKKQIAVLRQCNDEHIVKYYGSYFKDNNLWIVMQYCMAGSITDIVNITQKQLNQCEIASILQLVLKGLKYLHARKKIHRDIKAANILLDQHGTAKLADFGVSTEMMYTNARHNTHIGSPYWMSPQVIKYSEYNQKTDIWSLGVTAIELAEGVVPYSHLKPFMAMWTMKDKPTQSFKQPQKWSLQFNDFIKNCLQINPDLRPDAQELLHHDFIRKNSRGKRLLAELVSNSMAEIEHFRALQGKNEQESYDNQDFKELVFNKGDSNGSQYETKTFIVKNNERNKNSEDSIIQRSSNSKSFKKSKSIISYDKNKLNEQYNDDDAECGSVVFKGDDDKGHSRNFSTTSVSSVLVKDGNGFNLEQKSSENTNYLQSYIKNLHNMHSQQQQFKQNIQNKIFEIQNNFMKLIQAEYVRTRLQIKDFFINEKISKPGSSEGEKVSEFQSQMLDSQSLLQFIYKSETFEQEREKLEEDYKEKYLSSIQPVQNNYISMMLEPGNSDNSAEYRNQEYPNGDDDNLFLKESLNLQQQYRKKSQSSADSPTSLFNNRKKNIKKLIIQQALQQPDSEFFTQQERDSQSVNVSSNKKKSFQKQINNKKQSSISKLLQKTPLMNSQNGNKNRYKEIFVNSANLNQMGNKSLLSSQTNYGNSTTSGLRGQKRVITTQPHQAYDYDNDSVSTLTKHQRNFKQFYDDPVVMNNLKQHTQQSEEFISGTQLNPFELKKSSFSKEIKSVKSKQKQKDKFFMREKQRATHIAHIAMAHNKDRTITNSNKKLKVIKIVEQRDRSPPEDNSESMKTTKAKKSKSKNKQTASTTIPFGSVGNMGALDFLPGKIGKSKQKRVSQIPVKTGPFSKVKNRN